MISTTLTLKFSGTNASSSLRKLRTLHLDDDDILGFDTDIFKYLNALPVLKSLFISSNAKKRGLMDRGHCEPLDYILNISLKTKGIISFSNHFF